MKKAGPEMVRLSLFRFKHIHKSLTKYKACIDEKSHARACCSYIKE